MNTHTHMHTHAHTCARAHTYTHTKGRSYPDFFPGSGLRFGWVTSHLSLFSVTNNVTRHICHISGKNVTLSHTKISFLTCDVFCHILPEKRHNLAPPVKNFFNGKKCDDSAGTETCFSLAVSDVSLISEAWSGKAFWAKTDPYTYICLNVFVVTTCMRSFYAAHVYSCVCVGVYVWVRGCVGVCVCVRKYMCVCV